MRYFQRKNQQKGYVLPATIALGLGVAIVSMALLQATFVSSQNLNNASYQAIAQEAANAGLAFVQSCVQNGTIGWTTDLSTGMDCGGASIASPYITQQGTDWRSSFTIRRSPTVSNGLLTALSTGKVQLLANNGTTVVATFTAKAKITMPSVTVTWPVATGKVITDIKNTTSDCAIANGKLYCWGDNSQGQLGRGYNGNGNDPVTGASIGTPQAVGGALAGKTVTKVSVALSTVCAVADGVGYCWGDNTYRQLGGTGSGSLNIPTIHVPDDSAANDLYNKKIIDIQTASENNPAGILDIAADGKPHTCALIADGTVACWGANDFRQLTGQYTCYIGIWPFAIPAQCYPDRSTPSLIDGYTGTSVDNGLPQKGVKAEKISAGTHFSCLGGQGSISCWGPPIPLSGTCFFVYPAGPADHPYAFPVAPFVTPNNCTDTYSNGYALGGDFSAKSADANTWDMSTDAGCGMANTDFVCMGMAAAFGGWVFPGFSAPQTKLSTANITSADNGDNGLGNGIYCVVNNGSPSCTGSRNTGTGSNTLNAFSPLITTGTTGTDGLAGRTATKIAAGSDHGCVVAAGQLLCWGDGTNGTLADGNKNGHTVPNATVTGSGVVGAATGTYAAHDSISVGKDFTCGIVNAHVFCWGDNTNGKLGQGSLVLPTSLSADNTLKHPVIVPKLSTMPATKVSAGTNHACAIVYDSDPSLPAASNHLYCWGDNTYGQLGLGPSGPSAAATPQLVSGFAGMRITDVSAGDRSTCVVANGTVYCWGDDTNGQMGSGNAFHTPRKQLTPLAISLGAGVNATSVSVGTTHVCAIGNADAYCWGDNTYGETGTSSLASATPVSVAKVLYTSTGLPNGPNGMSPAVTAISAGNNFTCGIFNAVAQCWGNNANGRTAQSTTSSYVTTPSPIKGTAAGYYATGISAGDSHACAILDGNSSGTNGNLFCWGSMANGRLGYSPQPGSDISSVNTPINPTTGGANNVAGNDSVGKSVTNIAAGFDSSCAIANGDILCWGLGSGGQLGNDTVATEILPTITANYIVGIYVRPMFY